MEASIGPHDLLSLKLMENKASKQRLPPQVNPGPRPLFPQKPCGGKLLHAAHAWRTPMVNSPLPAPKLATLRRDRD